MTIGPIRPIRPIRPIPPNDVPLTPAGAAGECPRRPVGQAAIVYFLSGGLELRREAGTDEEGVSCRWALRVPCAAQTLRFADLRSLWSWWAAQAKYILQHEWAVKTALGWYEAGDSAAREAIAQWAHHSIRGLMWNQLRQLELSSIAIPARPPYGWRNRAIRLASAHWEGGLVCEAVSDWLLRKERCVLESSVASSTSKNARQSHRL